MSLSTPVTVPFNRPAVTGDEKEFLEQVLASGRFAAGGPFSERCSEWLERRFGVARALTTASGTHALEMAALLCDLEPGDEVVLPSFAFSSTATAFVRCGARLVFVDIDPRTMNADPEAVASAITDRTRVLVAVHYAGVSCDMAALEPIVRRHGLIVVEDAAQAILADYEDRPCGTMGDFGCFSFHETKNVQCGEGGALFVRDPERVERAEIVWEKGTDRARFLRGEIDKYTWRDLGSSFGLGELGAAFLHAQLLRSNELTQDRLHSWSLYHSSLQPLARRRIISIPDPPPSCRHNGHLFWLKARDRTERTALIDYLRRRGIQAVFHYEPLHASAAGRKMGRFHGEDRHTKRDASRLVRLPLFYGLEERDLERVVAAVAAFYDSPS